MSSKLDEVFQFHQTAMTVRGYRQQLLASNIANADTPNFKARDIDFSKTMQEALAPGSSGSVLSVTSPRHIGGAGNGIGAKALYRTPVQPSIDGNTVNMDTERTQFAENAIHYEANLALLNGQIKFMMSAIQG
jgi:flagellar basal-body rod protein FlgB